MSEKQWWFRPALGGIRYRYSNYPGAGWLPCSTKRPPPDDETREYMERKP